VPTGAGAPSRGLAGPMRSQFRTALVLLPMRCCQSPAPPAASAAASQSRCTGPGSTGRGGEGCGMRADAIAFRQSMRRLPASLLLAVLLWSFTAPAVLAATGLDLPPCCRAHHGRCHCGCSCCGRPDDDSPGFHRNATHCRSPLLGSILHAPAATGLRSVSLLAPSAARRLVAIEIPSNALRPCLSHAGRGPPGLTI